MTHKLTHEREDAAGNSKHEVLAEDLVPDSGLNPGHQSQALFLQFPSFLVLMLPATPA